MTTSPSTLVREKMPTPGGHSVRGEIDARLAAARTDALDEAVAFLRRAGFDGAAAALEKAAFGAEEAGPKA